MRQRTKLGIALFVLALVLSGVVVGGVERFRQGAQAEAQQTIDQTAETVANQTSVEIDGDIDRLQALSSQQGVQERTAIDRNLLEFTKHSRFRIAIFVAPNGTITAARGLDEEVRNNTIGSTAESSYIQKTLEREDAREEVGPPAWDDQRQEYVVQIAHPVEKDGKNVGVVAGALAVSEVTGSIEAVNTSGRTAKLSAWNGSAVVDIREPTQEFNDTINATSTVALPGTDWVVTVIEDQAPLNERLNDLRRIQFGSLLVVFLGIIGLGYWEYSTNLKQTERLLDGFRELRDGNYEYTVSLSSATEWQRISEGYNELTFGLKEREQAIREREQQLEVLNRVLRHNLQNDMNVIIGHAEMLPRFSDDDRVADASETIVRMGEELVGHGQKARQLESAMGQAAEIRDIDIVPQIQSVVGSYERDYPDVTFRTELPESATARALETVEMAIDNLVENAAEHNDSDEPLVEVGVESDDETVAIHVCDNGPGIPDHEKEVLESGAETALKHGSGVGLWLAFWLVDRSHGTLTFSDRSPRGSVVTIEFPTASAASERETAEKGEKEDRTVIAAVTDRLGIPG